LQEILHAEGSKIDDNALEILIESSGNDIRQMINMLQLQSSSHKNMSFMDAKKSLFSVSKDEQNMLTAFDAATKMLTKRDFQPLNFTKKLNLFFIDFDLMPLLIHENYLQASGPNRNVDDIKKMAESADYISLGDCMNNTLRGNQEWTLLPNVGLCSCVAPAILSGNFCPFAKFPQ
jgi:replication factor C subunit 1